MSIVSGAKLGPYEIQAPLGAGGMGEVYRARDTRLDRTVAIKVLPSHLSASAQVRQRFEREARALSSFSHPHICTLYDVGHENDVDFLVMEFLEGESLAARLEKGPLPTTEVLRYAVQIADALDKAHRQGLIHRDLKPGNIVLTKSGAKLLDFGLAKAATNVVAAASAETVSLGQSAQAQPITSEGTIVGTFQYMAPEQLEGKPADARTDIFAFGAVLYEMATGRGAFTGKSRATIVAAILSADTPSISSLQPTTPPALDRVVKTCLAKDPEERFHTAHDLKLQLQWIAEAGSQAGVPVPLTSRRKLRERLLWGAAAILLLSTIVLAAVLVLRTPRPEQPILLTAEMGADASLSTIFGPSAVLSPDGTRLAFVATSSDDRESLYVRQLNHSQATLLPGTDYARDPFFSPDGEWIGFFTETKLKKISVHGGAPVTLCEAGNDRGASWGDDGAIVFAPRPTVGLMRIPSAGGNIEQLTKLTEGSQTHRWPQTLPGGKSVLFTSNVLTGTFEDADIVAYRISTGEQKTIFHGGYHGRYLPSGHLVYIHEGTLFSVPFDLKRLQVTGQPAPILEGVATNNGTGGAQFSFSETGALVYVTGSAGDGKTAIYWMERDGKFRPLREIPDFYLDPAFSPDGKRLTLEISDGRRSDIWIYDIARDALTRLTFGADSNRFPIWTPDGQRITYVALEGGKSAFYWKRADGSGDPQRLAEGVNNQQAAHSWHPNGKFLAFAQINSETHHWNVMILPMEGDEKSGWKPREPQVLLHGPYEQLSPAFSPDGHWLAYASNESGNFEVYVRPFPGPGGKWQVSTGAGGGHFPKWSPNSKELFYLTASNSRIMVAAYRVSGSSFLAERPQPWSPARFLNLGLGPFTNFDLHPDGKRFVVIKTPGLSEGQPLDKVTFILNFFDALRRKVPTGQN